MDCSYIDARRGKEDSMNPLINTNLDMYVKDLVDHYIPGKSGEDKDSTGCAKTSPNRSVDTNPPTGENKRQ
jgi:hypothetical protein